MLAGPDEAGRSGATLGDGPLFFNPATKCCTYVPELHNFLVGQILSDPDPALAHGRLTVEARLRAGIGATPLGLAPPASYRLQYEHGWMAFGRSRTMRCPHYIEQSGRCGVWKYRESTCCTWFCKYVRGAVGQNFWREGVHPLLSVVERQLALWCLLDLGLEPETLRAVLAPGPRVVAPESLRPDELDGRADRVEYRRLWGGWLGREADLYRECAARVQELAWKQVLEICGAEARSLARLTLDAYARLVDDSLPERLEAAPVQLVQIRPATCRLSSYANELDPVELPTPVLDALRYFDGRPVGEALEDIRKQQGISLEPDLLRKLVDFSVLRRPAAEKPPAP